MSISGIFLTSLIFGLLGLLWLAIAPSKIKDPDNAEQTYNAKKFAVIPLFLALLFFFLSCFTVVGTQDVGIPTSFSKTTGDTYQAGLHVKPPWYKVTDIDGSVQPEEYRGKECIYVKIADGGSACIAVAYRWRINKEQADIAYSDYRKADGGVLLGIRKALVSTNVKAAINEVLGKYDPLSGTSLNSNMTPDEIANIKVNVVPDYEQINKDIKTNLERKIAGLGGLIDIESVTVSYVELPESTQKRINAFNAAVQDTKIALQQVATKRAQADANRELASSLKDPNVLVSKCLDGLIAGDIQNQPGFSCSLGGGSAVVIPGAAR